MIRADLRPAGVAPGRRRRPRREKPRAHAARDRAPNERGLRPVAIARRSFARPPPDRSNAARLHEPGPWVAACVLDFPGAGNCRPFAATLDKQREVTDRAPTCRPRSRRSAARLSHLAEAFS